MIPNADDLGNTTQSEIKDAVENVQEIPNINSTDTPQTGTDDTTPNTPRLKAEEGANTILKNGYVPFPAGLLNIGMDKAITLPSPEQQKAGFKLSDGDRSILNHQFPQYVPLVPKGGNA